MKILVLVLFALVAVIQLYIPASMIFGREKIIEEGEVLKFRTAPVDPSDPFRGKYIDLDFSETDFMLKDTTKQWQMHEEVYVLLKKDPDGFARVEEVLQTKPDEGLYVKARIRSFWPYENPEKIFIRYPFDRFYMEESKAYDAEIAYQNTLSDTTKNTYALVHILEGEAVLTEVMIDDTPVLEYLLQEK